MRLAVLLSSGAAAVVALSAHPARADEPAPPRANDAPAAPGSRAAPESRGTDALTFAPAEGPRAAEATTRYPPSSVRPKLIVGGLAIGGLAWGSGYLVASNSPDVPGSSELKIPVVGPWIALLKNDCGTLNPNCGASVYFRAVALFVEGLIQAGGLGIAAEGVFMTTEADGAAPKAKAFLEWRSREGGLSIMPSPFVTARSSGLGFTGTF